MERDNALDAVKGFAILLVMIGHCIVLNGLNTSDPYVYDAIKSVQMPLFMMVSGVLAAKGCQVADRQSWARGIKKIPKRACSYLIPFGSWFVISYMVTHLLSRSGSISDFFTEFRELLFQTDKGLWFLMTLFIIMVVVTLSQAFANLLCVRYRFVLFLCFIAVFYGIFFLQSRSGNSFLSPALTVQYLPFYLLGYLAKGYGEKLYQTCICKIKGFRIMELLVWVVSLLLFLTLLICQDLTAPVQSFRMLLVQMLASLLGTVCCYAAVYTLAKKNRQRLLPFAGMYTLEIYVLHFRFARLLHLSDKHLTFYSLQAFGWLLLTFALMCLLTAISIYLIKKVWLLDLLLFGKLPNHRSDAPNYRVDALEHQSKLK